MTLKSRVIQPEIKITDWELYDIIRNRIKIEEWESRGFYLIGEHYNGNYKGCMYGISYDGRQSTIDFFESNEILGPIMITGKRKKERDIIQSELSKLLDMKLVLTNEGEVC